MQRNPLPQEIERRVSSTITFLYLNNGGINKFDKLTDKLLK